MLFIGTEEAAAPGREESEGSECGEFDWILPAWSSCLSELMPGRFLHLAAAKLRRDLEPLGLG